MTEEASHIIKTQQYQIQMDDAKNAPAFQTKISNLQTSIVNTLLERILSEYSESGYLIQFDEIVLDLGTVTNANWEKEIPFRIEEQLIRFLKSAIWESGTTKKGKKIKIKQNQIELLEHFLLHGYVSWNYPAHIRPVELFSQLIARKDKAFVALLKNSGKNETVRKRLITQFDDTILENIVFGVSGHQQKYIIYFRQYISNFQKKYKFIDANERNFRNALWEIILTAVFTETNVLYKKELFTKYVLQKIAVKFNIKYAILLTDLLGSSVEFGQDIQFDSDFQKVILNLNRAKVRIEIIDTEKGGIASDKLLLDDFEALLNYFLEHESFAFNSGIHSIEDFLERIKKYIKIYTKEHGNLSHLIGQVYKILLSKSFSLPTPVINELHETIAASLNNEKRIAESFLITALGEQAFNLFLTRLNECILQETSPVIIRQRIIDIIAQQVSTSSLTKEVLIEKMIALAKGNLYSDNRHNISPELLLYLYELTDQTFTRSALQSLLVQLSMAMFLDQGNETKDSADRILFQYADKNALDRTSLARQLKNILYNESKQFPVGIFHKDMENYLKERSGKQKQSMNVAVTSIQCAVDVLEYYALYKKMPSWAKEAGVKQLSRPIEYLNQKNPNSLRNIVADNCTALLPVVSHVNYLSMIRLLEDSNIPEFVFQLHTFLEECIAQHIIPVWAEGKKIKRALRLLFAELILSKSDVLNEKQKLMDICIHEIIKILPLQANDMADLLLERRPLMNAAKKNISEIFNTLLPSISSVSLNKEDIETKIAKQEFSTILDRLEDEGMATKSDAVNASKQILNFSKIHRNLFLQQIRHPQVRRTLLNKLSKRYIIHLISIHSDEEAKAAIHASIHLLLCVRKFLTATQGKQLLEKYMDGVLFKFSVDGSERVGVKEIAWIFYKSMELILQKRNTISIFKKLEAKSSEVSFKSIEKKLLKQIQSVMRKKATSGSKKLIIHKTVGIKKAQTEKELIGTSVFLRGAGVIILNPFIPMLFSKLNLVSGPDFNSDACRVKGVQLLYYAVFGNSILDETDTLLFKILCGMAEEASLEITEGLSEEEQQLVDGLLASVTQQWSILKNTSIAGLRESFLQREGKLQIEEEAYMLYVEAKSFDMLLDQIPWTISKLKFSWMKKILLVQWR